MLHASNYKNDTETRVEVSAPVDLNLYISVHITL